jgi:diguanylate cyclase (GGDEF)-like protein/PAS domain S-box-containing protein
MYKILTCVAFDHDPVLVALAATLCFLSCYVATMLLDRAQKVSGRARWVWLATVGAAAGFGIWSTHFIAMLAYDPGVVVGYQPSLTFISLGIAIVATAIAASIATFASGVPSFIGAGIFFGLGVASMHFTGMAAIDFPGTISWDRGYVVASIVFGALFSAAAFWASATIRGLIARKLVVTLLLSLGVVLLHFTAMAGVTVHPGTGMLNPAELLSPSVMVVTIAAVSLSLLFSGLAAAVFAVRAEVMTSASEARFKMLVQGVTDYAIYMLDLQGRVSNWNLGAERAKGYTADEIVGRDFSQFYSEEDRKKGLPQRALAIARTEGKFEAEGWRYRKDGTSFWAHIVIDPIYNEAHELIGYAKITKDITQQKLDAERMLRITRNLDIALENMSQGICLFDGEERLVLSNHRYSEIFGFPKGFIRPGLSYRQIVEKGYQLAGLTPEAFLQRTASHYDRHMAVVRSGQGMLVHKLGNGNSVQATYNAMADGGWVVTFEDITERLRSEEKISFMARHDSLTGLPNRTEFNEYLTQELAIARRAGTRLAVIGIDLDKFKDINDQHGHAAGDQVLTGVAGCMSKVLRPGEFVARFGGDEFSAIKRFDEMSDLHDFIGRIEGCLTGDMNFDGFEIKTGASLGIALYPQDADNAETLLGNADLAMYRAKNHLKQRVCFYEVAMDEAARSRRNLANDLWAAIEQKQMHLHYQIQKSVSTGATTGYEVLLRWQHPERGNVPPMDFITLAEECGAILPIGEWVLREACREAATWSEPHKIAVNLSPVQLSFADMAELVHLILLETGLDPRRLEIEITESSIITDKERALSTLKQIKALGVSIAIDDFGTGYSSLETLRAFPFDKIKLDRSFMNEVETSPQAKAIVRAILALGQSLEVPVLAEGVETQDQLDILMSEGCDEAQGYLLGRPKSIESIRNEEKTIIADKAA